MDNPFIIAAEKAFRDCLLSDESPAYLTGYDKQNFRLAELEFKRRLEAAAKAFDACKTGMDLSMTHLATEMNKAWWKSIKRYKLDYDEGAAQLAFQEAMKPHFEVRLF